MLAFKSRINGAKAIENYSVRRPVFHRHCGGGRVGEKYPAFAVPFMPPEEGPAEYGIVIIVKPQDLDHFPGYGTIGS
jgi:hypothetical protein